MANYNSSYTGAQVDNAVKQFTNNTATSGQVATADGNGSATWSTPANKAVFSLSGTTLTITNS